MEEAGDKVSALIVAAGTSSRMGGIDKIFARLGQEPLLAVVTSVFQSCSSIDEIVIVLAQNNLESGLKLVKERDFTKVIAVCAGGLKRSDSVEEGLGHLVNCGWVVIHDGARPFVTTKIIERGLIIAKKSGAAIAAVPVKDTIKVVSDQFIVLETLKRQKLWAAQTPQVFRYDLIMDAYRKREDEDTDDATMVERLGHSIEVYMGSYRNIKITVPEDLAIAGYLLDAGENPSRYGGTCVSALDTMCID